MKEKSKIVPFGISLPEELVDEIDFLRGDITRSRYILRLIETGLDIKRKKGEIT